MFIVMRMGDNQSQGAKGWIMYGIISKLKLGDQLKNLKTT